MISKDKNDILFSNTLKEGVSLYKIKNDELYCAYNQAGVLVTLNANKDFIVIDMIGLKSYYSREEWLDRIEINEFLKPCFCGLSLPVRKLILIMGKEDCGVFLKNRETMYDEYRF